MVMDPDLEDVTSTQSKERKKKRKNERTNEENPREETLEPPHNLE